MNIQTQISTSEDMMANAIRALAMDAVQAANSGHPGVPMGIADVATVLFNRFMKIDPTVDKWPDRDRFVMSAGHGSMLIYAINHLLGYDDMGMDQLRAFRQMGARTAGHPEYGHAKGIEVTTGPLGRGFPPPSAWRWPNAWAMRVTATIWSTISPMSSPVTVA